MPAIIKSFPWPKSMRWGAASAKPGSLRWVRPLQSIVCTFGPETEEPVVVDFEVDGIRSGNVTYGHRFHAPEAITVRRFDDYVAKLEAAKVVLDADRRKEIILADARNLAFASGLDLVEDEGLLEEVSGLVEWPVVLMGDLRGRFLEIPAEVIRLTIRANQKCFVTRPHGSEDELSNHFVLTVEHRGEGRRQGDRPRQRQGGARPPFGRALFLEDRPGRPARSRHAEAVGATSSGSISNKPLDQRMARLDHLGVTFHAKLGTQGERVERIRGAGARDRADRRRRARAGRTRGRACQGRPARPKSSASSPNCRARWAANMRCCRARARPSPPRSRSTTSRRGRPTACPTDPVSVAVALADKLDTLVGFWAIDEKPTGSKDPYALRRAALGVVRIILAARGAMPLQKLFDAALRQLGEASVQRRLAEFEAAQAALNTGDVDGEQDVDNALAAFEAELRRELIERAAPLKADLLAFFHDRLKVYLRELGARHDLIDAVISPDADDLLAVTRRVEALGKFLDTEDGKNLLAGTKRAANILAAEEKKGTAVAEAVDPALFREEAEKALFAAVNQAVDEAGEAIRKEDFSAAMRALSVLREPVDTFFDKVLVNDEDAAVRANRLALLARIRAATDQVADFSKIAG